MKELHLFIAKDERSGLLMKSLEKIIMELPPEERPKVKVHVVNINKVEDFQAYLAYLSEVYGGIFLAEFRKYGVERLPSIIYGDRKVLEGYFPDEEELRELLSRLGLPVVKEPAAVGVSKPEGVTPSSPRQEPQEKVVEKPEVKSRPQLSPAPRRTVGESATLPGLRPLAGVKGTCNDCIFYDSSRGWCVLHRVKVEDPLNPPCGRRGRGAQSKFSR